MKDFCCQPGCKKGFLVIRIKIEIHIDEIVRFHLWPKLSQAANQPEPNTIVERTVDKSMDLVTWDIIRAEGTVRAGYFVAEYSVLAFLGG